MFSLASWTGWSLASLLEMDGEELMQWVELIPEDTPPPRSPL